MITGDDEHRQFTNGVSKRSHRRNYWIGLSMLLVWTSDAYGDSYSWHVILETELYCSRVERRNATLEKYTFP